MLEYLAWYKLLTEARTASMVFHPVDHQQLTLGIIVKKTSIPVEINTNQNHTRNGVVYFKIECIVSCPFARILPHHYVP